MSNFCVYLSVLSIQRVHVLFCFTAVSKSLSFTEKSLVITEVTEKDVVMEAITTQIKEAESMKCTVEIVVHYYNFFQFDN